jgi:hypothetical protein
VVVMIQGGVEEDPQTVGLKNWDTITARLADSATLAFLLLQLPQIILNTQNLMAGNQGALFAIPWMVCFLTLSHHSRCCCCRRPVFSQAILPGDGCHICFSDSIESFWRCFDMGKVATFHFIMGSI